MPVKSGLGRLAQPPWMAVAVALALLSAGGAVFRFAQQLGSIERLPPDSLAAGLVGASHFALLAAFGLIADRVRWFGWVNVGGTALAGIIAVGFDYPVRAAPYFTLSAISAAALVSARYVDATRPNAHAAGGSSLAG